MLNETVFGAEPRAAQVPREVSMSWFCLSCTLDRLRAWRLSFIWIFMRRDESRIKRHVSRCQTDADYWLTSAFDSIKQTSSWTRNFPSQNQNWWMSGKTFKLISNIDELAAEIPRIELSTHLACLHEDEMKTISEIPNPSHNLQVPLFSADSLGAVVSLWIVCLF